MTGAFADLLLQHRIQRRLTQESLAELAGISARSVRELERRPGRSPRPDSVRRLTVALGLTGTDRADFIGAAHTQSWTQRVGVPPRAAPSAWLTRQLPADLPDFVGREAQLAALGERLDPGAARTGPVTISGPPGVGKSALAVHAGHLAANRFPDGQLYVRLHGNSANPAHPTDVLGSLLSALSVSQSEQPTGVDARAALFRARLAGRHILLVLDDAAGHHQVEPLLPGSGVAVVITGRLPLTGLPGVTSIDLGPLDGAASVDLLGHVAGGHRVRQEPAAAARLVSLCGGLPLAVRIAAARLAAHPQWRVADLVKRLADDSHRLDELRHGDQAVRPALEVAYRGLHPPAARAVALLAALNLPSVPAWPVARLLDVSPDAGVEVLDELLNSRLVDELFRDRAGQPRYGLHQLTALYARERRLADIEHDQWRAAVARVADGWLALARVAGDHLHGRYLSSHGHLSTADPVDPPAVDVAASLPAEWFSAERESVTMLASTCVALGFTTTANALADCLADVHPTTHGTSGYAVRVGPVPPG